MKARLITCFLLISFRIYSQDYSSADLFDRDINGKINFSEVIQVDSITKDFLYYNAKVFFADVFKSANDVVQMDDKENGVLIGKGFTNLYSKAVFRDGLFIFLDFTASVQMWFTIKIQCKDNRYKYEIYDLYFIGNSPYSYNTKLPYSAEFIFDKNRISKRNSIENLMRCKKDVEDKIYSITSSLKSSLCKRQIDNDF